MGFDRRKIWRNVRDEGKAKEEKGSSYPRADEEDFEVFQVEMKKSNQKVRKIQEIHREARKENLFRKIIFTTIRKCRGSCPY